MHFLYERCLLLLLLEAQDYRLPRCSDLLSPPPQAPSVIFPTLTDTRQLCSIHLHFPESTVCNWFLRLLPDVPFPPYWSQLPARVNALCTEGADRRPSLGVCRSICSLHRCDQLLTDCSSSPSRRGRRSAVYHQDAPCTGRCRTKVCAATARVRPMPARTAPCWTKPCPMTSSSAPPHLTTVHCPLALSTTREHPTSEVSAQWWNHMGPRGATETSRNMQSFWFIQEYSKAANTWEREED